MYPTLEEGDCCFVRRFNINPKRYDIVTAKANGQVVIKRVIGLPGDVLEIEEGYVLINGNPVLGQYNFETNDYGILNSCYIVKENEFFLMGDNREASVDSRKFGSVDIEKITGIVEWKAFPFWEMKKFPHGEE